MEASSKTRKESEERVAEEYLSSLSDLNCNSKPLINMLTMLAEENIEYAAVIVKVVEQHIAKVSPDIKLPILYLIDSIVKNVKSTYVQLFSQCIVSIFCGVFEKVNEKVRERMYALRQTWNEVFSPQKLYALDVKVKRMDANWPITAKQPMQPSIHVNPNFLKNVNSAPTIPSDMEEILHAKTRELLELKKRKLELELEATKKHLEEQEKQLTKATESVIAPPGEAPGAVGTVSRPPANHHRQHPMSAQRPVGTAMRPPGMYPTFRNPRPQQPHMAPPGLMNTQQAFPVNSSMGKAKVHPVTPSLLNSVRPRDPRLARQQQQQQQQQQHQQEQIAPSVQAGHSIPKPSVTQTSEDEKKVEFGDVGSEKPAVNKLNNRNVAASSAAAGVTTAAGSFATKPFSRQSSKRGGSSHRSTSGRSSSKNSQRDRERDRRRGSAYASSNGAAFSDHRRRMAGDVGSSYSNLKTRCEDKDAFEIPPLSSAFKRKSSSPATSPGKAKEFKRSSKFRSGARARNHSRSPSPEAAAAAFKDVDLRVGQKKVPPEKRIKCPPESSKRDTNFSEAKEHIATTVITSSATTEAATTKDLDKNVEGILLPMPMFPGKDVDLRQLAVSSTPASISSAVVVSSEPCANVVTTISSPRVSFKIQKPFNVLEKSTENLSLAKEVAADNADVKSKRESKHEVVGDDKPARSTVLQNNEVPQQKALKMVVDNVAEDYKKRHSGPIADEEEILPKKKIKQTKLDALFGSEDVDLRTVPPQILAAQQGRVAMGNIMTAPPPPVISEEQKVNSLDVPKNIMTESKISTKVDTGTTANITIKKSSLEDVRAKLAKAARYDKLEKLEKTSKDIKRPKAADLGMNDEALEANDQKIRTIISQAQDLHESGSINDDQYKHLVKTVMSLNETKKLREAKWRESLTAAKSEEKVDVAENSDLADVDAERMAARDAILKKRIPKLKEQAEPNKTDSVGTSQPPSSDKKAEDSVIYEDNNEKQQETKELSSKQKLNNDSQQARNKTTNWDEPVLENPQLLHEAPSSHTLVVTTNTTTTWHLGSAAPFNKRPGFSSRVPHPPLPPLPNPNLRLPQIALPSPWQIGAGVVPPPFAPAQVQLLRSSVPPPPQPPVVALPPIPALPKPCNSIDNPQADMVRNITIDGLAKEIRIYGEVAIVFMESDQPREIVFQAGQRSIIIDNMEPLLLRFNDDFKQITIDGEVHQVRFGFPSRELYIDDNWYEIYFGGPAVSIPLKNKFHMLKAEGPPPQVNIGTLRRDLVVGKINMIVNADIIIPVFLDARPQTFQLSDKVHTIQFADNLLTVLLDGEVAPVEYGALPKRYTLGGVTYFIRFSTLPQGVVPGKVYIKDMIYIKTEPPVDPTPQEIATSTAEVTSTTETVSYGEAAKSEATSTAIPKIPQATLNNLNIDELFQKLVSSGILGAAKTTAPATITSALEVKPEIASLSTTQDSTTQPDQETINPIDLRKPETIKTRQVAVVSTLFSGMQCSSCGVRFPPEQTIKYSQHLDWHFRQNRRERDSTRKAHSRKWYYCLSDWVQYEEIEDVEEREKNFFESQQNEVDIFDEGSSNQRATNSPPPSCAAGPDDVDRGCDMCHEKFEHFYNEELEEWHMRCAVRVEDKIYHPLCYEDYKASLNPPEKPAEEASADNEAEIINDDDDNATDSVIKIEEGDETDPKNSVTIADDDDDDVIVLPNEEPSVTEIVDDDDDEYIPTNVTREEMGTAVEDGKTGVREEPKDINDTVESDVEIQEPNIPFTDLDTYEEKELPEGDDTSQAALLNVKIKEEPKDDEEDDGFEDVGTVVIPLDEEISIQSSVGSPTHTIALSAPSPSLERPVSVSSQQESTSPEFVDAAVVSISLDDTETLETDDPNLSAAEPPLAKPVSSLVNKIKINITKNIMSSSSSSSSTAITTTSSLNSNESTSVSSNGAATPPTAISTIPVLCGGTSSATTTNSSGSTPIEGLSENVGGDRGGISAISVIGSNIYPSNISVIGSYGSSSRYHPSSSSSSRASTSSAKSASAKATEKVVPPEEVIEFKFKPALEKVALKKMKKVERGVETSGLCSIM